METEEISGILKVDDDPIDSETLNELLTPEIINAFRERTKNAKMVIYKNNKVYKWENNELIEVKKRKSK